VRARALPWALRYRLGSQVASALRLVTVRATHLHCRVEIDRPVFLGPGFSLLMPDGGAFVVGPGVDFRRGFACEIRGEGCVEIGPGSVFTSNVLIQCSTSITIGARCAFGQSTLIVDGSHRYGDPDVHWMEQGYDHHPIRIGDGAGVSDKCTIQADLGERAMVASGSVVNRPVPPYCLVAGAPARLVRYVGPPERRDEILGAAGTTRRNGAGPGAAPGGPTASQAATGPEEVTTVSELSTAPGISTAPGASR